MSALFLKEKLKMEKRLVKKLGVTVSRLGMGHMRLPEKDGEIDFDAARTLVDALMVGGVNYYDTAWVYHGGKSEEFTRKALVERYPRDSFFVATKLALWGLKTPEQCENMFEQQRKNLGVDTIDFYLLHSLSGGSWSRAKTLKAHELQLRLKQEGKIRFAGFSFHGDNSELPAILDDGKWDFVQLQINYADWSMKKADEIYGMVKERGIPLILMEPVRGGGLASFNPDISRHIEALGQTPARLALRWAADLDAADIILSGMSTMAQVEENLETFESREAITPKDKEVIERVLDGIRRIPAISCTDCKYCTDCPQGLKIYELFSSYNEYVRFGNTWWIDDVYFENPESSRASACVECGACEGVCPQKLPIIQELKKVHEKAMEVHHRSEA